MSWRFGCIPLGRLYSPHYERHFKKRRDGEYRRGGCGCDAECSAGGKVLEIIKQWFGSYEQWEDEFKKIANALGGGSGWAIFAHNAPTGEFHNYWSWDHMHNAPTSRPLLVLDMYEHAYHMDYGAAAAKYVDAFLQNVNWEEVNRRAEAATR